MKGFIGISTVLLATLFIALASLSALLLNVSGLLQEPETSLGGLSGHASAASTTNFTVSSTAIRLTATSSCAARIISTNKEVSITFSDAFGERPTATAGLKINATTSPQVFAAEDVGCGTIYGISSTGVSATLEITDSF